MASATRLGVALLVIVIWSACFVVIKASQGEAPALLYGALRALLGGLPLLGVAAATGRLRPPPGLWRWLALLAVANTTLGLAGMFLSVGLAGAAIPGVLANSQALLVAPFAAWLFGEALTPSRVLALLLALAGVALIMPWSGQPRGTASGAALALTAAAGLAAATLIIKHIGPAVDALTATAWQYLLGALPLLAASAVLERAAPVLWTPRFVAGLLFLGLVGSAGASWMWYVLVRDGELIWLNALTLLTPAFALLLALVLYREPLPPSGLVGVAAVLGGVTWLGWPRGSRARR